MAYSERALEWTGIDEPEIASSKLRSVRRLVLISIACEAWYVLGFVPYSSTPFAYGLVAIALFLCAITGWRDRFARASMVLAFVLLLGVVVSAFPDNANHQYLALILLGLMLLVSPSGPEVEADTRAALASMRWIALVGVVWAGVMKLYYGYWLGGEFLAYRVASDPGFTRTLGLLVPDVELARLTSLGLDVGAGPFRADAPLLVLVSNLTWILEIALPLGLLFQKSRLVSMVATIVLFVAIQIGAREMFFGGLMVGLLLLFDRRDRVAGALPWIFSLYVAWLLRVDIQRWTAGGAGA